MFYKKINWRKFNKKSFSKKGLEKKATKAEKATIKHAHKFIISRLENIRQSRRHIIGWLVLLTFLISITGFQLILFRQEYKTTAAADGGTYAEASLGPIETLNPLYASTSAEIASSKLLFSSLFNYDQTGTLNNDIAQTMTIDPTGKIYTIKLNNTAKWHDGTNLTAQDVEFTINLIKNPETRSILRSNWQNITAKAIDETTITFTTPEVYAAFSDALTFAILPKHILNEINPSSIRESNFSQAPIGSGPFMFKLLQNTDSTKDHTIVNMSAFEAYFKGSPKLNRFELHAYENRDLIIKALKTGEVNAAADLSNSDIAQVSTASYERLLQPVNSGVYAIMNTKQPLLKEKSVRQALQIATDTKAIRDSIDPQLKSIDLPFVNGQLTGDGIAQLPATNIVRANELLESSGWKLVNGIREKDNQKLSLSVVTIKDSDYEKAINILTQQWRNVGVEIVSQVIDINNPSIDFVKDIIQPRQYDVLIYQLVIGADPDVYAYWHSSQANKNGYNLSNYTNTLADTSLASARNRLESDLRNAKYKTFARQWVEDAPAIGLYQFGVNYVYNKDIETTDPKSVLISATDRYSNLLYWSVNRQSVYKTP